MNANYVDFEDIQDSEEGEDELDGFVEGLSNKGKRAPPAVKWQHNSTDYYII